MSVKGAVHSIQTFGSVDGPGVHFVIFLKGCALRCQYCHNPDTWKCGEPDTDSEQLLKKALRYRSYWGKNGGITVSGGEPLLQIDFLLDLFQQAKKEGIHTAVETALQVDTFALRRALPLIDQLYCDFKLFDGEAHLRYTGRGNDRIKSHLRLLLTGPLRERVVVRTPMIPTITATQGNILAISRFLSALYPGAAYELLNYNPLARDKYRLLKKPYCLDPDPPRFTRAQMGEFACVARGGGLSDVRIDG